MVFPADDDLYAASVLSSNQAHRAFLGTRLDILVRIVVDIGVGVGFVIILLLDLLLLLLHILGPGIPTPLNSWDEAVK
jgi:hypothetical protein